MSSSIGLREGMPLPFTLLQYRDLSSCGALEQNGSSESGFCGQEVDDDAAEPVYSAEELAARVNSARKDAIHEAEQRMREEYEQKRMAALAPVARLLKEFEEERSEYFARVEAEVVQLALAIAAKILHREAQVDPMLVAALVRIALERMQEESNVVIRVGAGCASSWRSYFAGVGNLPRVEVTDDPQLSDHDCRVETELGSANFGLDAQLKEVEQGFFDLLALRPQRL